MNLHLLGPDREIAELDILLESGPLCVAGVWNWQEKQRVAGLYLLYLIRNHVGINFGPFYASLSLAERDMKKVQKAFPRGFWEQPLSWYPRQKEFHAWVDKNLGKPDDLVGGVWET